MIRQLWAAIVGCEHLEPHDVRTGTDIMAWLNDPNDSNWVHEKVRCLLCNSVISLRIVRKDRLSKGEENEYQEEARRAESR